MKKIINTLLAFLMLLIFNNYTLAVYKKPISLGDKTKKLADPDVYFDSKEKTYYLSGTAGVSNHIPFYTSKNGIDFKFHRSFNPSSIDSKYNYCHIWAPDFIKLPNGKYHLTFSASRFSKKGGKCDIQNVTTFRSVAKDKRLIFSKPVLLSYAARSNTSRGCYGVYSASQCERSIRIDSELFIDPITGKQTFFYNWFYKGNNISSFPYNKSEMRITRHISPAHKSEESIIEAPDVFKRGKYYYMIYSHGFFNKSYGLSYIYADSISKLTRNKGKVRSLYLPSFNYSISGCQSYNGKRITESGGHSSTVMIGKDYYIYYHINNYTTLKNKCHKYSGRSVHRSKLTFLSDGSILPFNKLLPKWNYLGKDYSYSLDIKLKSKKFIGACVNAGKLGNKVSYLFDGKCMMAKYAIKDIDSLRVCSSYKSKWKENVSCSKFYKVSDSKNISLYIPRPKTKNIVMSWNNLGNGYKYSMDIILKNGKAIGPCIHAGILNEKTSYEFNGQCVKGKYSLKDVKEVRVCSSYNGNWRKGKVRCSKKHVPTNKYISLFINRPPK